MKDAAEASRRGCDSATSAGFGDPPPSPGAVVIGPVRFEAVLNQGLPADLSHARSSGSSYLVFKTPTTIASNVVGGVTVRILGETGKIRLIYTETELSSLSSGTYRLPQSRSSVFLESCGGGTQYNGGFIMAMAGCAEVEVTDGAGQRYGPKLIPLGVASCNLPVTK
jgi:hypothetical protein